VFAHGRAASYRNTATPVPKFINELLLILIRTITTYRIQTAVFAGLAITDAFNLISKSLP